MGRIELNTLEIGSGEVTEESLNIRIGIESCAAVTVFPKTVAEDYPV